MHIGTEIQRKSHHCFGFGVKGSDKIGRILLLESDTRPERMRGVVLENATGCVVNQHQALLPAHVSKRQRSDDIRTDRLHLVRLAPVDVRAAGHSGGVEDVCGLYGGDVGLEGCPVLQATRAVNVVEFLSFAELTQQTAYPSGTAVDQEFEG